MKKKSQKSFYGSGLLFDSNFTDYILKNKPKVDWFEVITEQFMGSRHNNYRIHIPEKFLKFIELYPVSLHGIELSIGSVDDFDKNYLRQLKEIVNIVKPIWVSDHICWTGADGKKAHQLLPLPYTKETLEHVISRVHYVQDFLKERLVLENPPNYIMYQHSEMSETEFINGLARATGCGLILDLNNLYVSSQNNHFDPFQFIDQLDSQSIQQIHLAGFDVENDFLLDNHSRYVSPEVWKLYRKVTTLCGPVTTSLEWDLRVPPIEVLIDEAGKARKIQNEKQAGPKNGSKSIRSTDRQSRFD